MLFSFIGVLWRTRRFWQLSACCWFPPRGPCSLSRAISILRSLHHTHGGFTEKRSPLVWTWSKHVGVTQTDAAHWNCRCAVGTAPRAVTAACVWASSDASLDKGDTKVGLFIAASIGTFALMAAVYCIYTKFYTKQQYLHTQLNEDSGKFP